MKTLNRRALFAHMGGALLGATMLAGCATTKNGNVTKYTINVAKINAYIQAGLNAAATVTTAISLVPVLQTYTVPLKKITEYLQATQLAFTAAVGDRLEVAYDDSSIKTVIDSILAGIMQVADLIKTVLVSMIKATLDVSQESVAKVEMTYNSIATIVSLFKALVTTSFVSAADRGDVRYASLEGKALGALGVRA